MTPRRNSFCTRESQRKHSEFWKYPMEMGEGESNAKWEVRGWFVRERVGQGVWALNYTQFQNFQLSPPPHLPPPLHDRCHMTMRKPTHRVGLWGAPIFVCLQHFLHWSETRCSFDSAQLTLPDKSSWSSLFTPGERETHTQTHRGTDIQTDTDPQTVTHRHT